MQKPPNDKGTDERMFFHAPLCSGTVLPDSFVLANGLKKHSKLQMGPEPYAATAATATDARQYGTLVGGEGCSYLRAGTRQSGDTPNDA